MSINLLVTGSNGFIGKNLISFIKSNSPNILIKSFNRQNSLQELKDLIFSSDIIIHLAGQNRSNNNKDFILNNIELSKIICEIVLISLIFFINSFVTIVVCCNNLFKSVFSFIEFKG